MTSIDAIVVGSGPNGMAAAVTLARAGLSVTVYERASAIGGGARTAELTLPGFLHDVCSAVHPMALASPFFRAFGLSDRVPMVVPELSYAQPLDGGRSGLAYRDIDRTAAELGVDGPAWKRLFGPLAARANDLAESTGSTMLRVPEHPILLARFGLRMLEQGSPDWNTRFREDLAPALFTGVLAHAIRRLPSLSSAAAGLVLATHAHAKGWPIPVGGSQSIITAMADDLIAHGGRIETDASIETLAQLPSSRAVLLDTTPRAFLAMAGAAVPARYARTMKRFHYGSAVAKVDFALSGPVPWTDPRLAETATLHVGGTRAEVAAGEREVAAGRHPESPYVLVSQPSAFDSTRAPEGKHVLWAYTHVPRNSTVDRTEAMIRQIERFAPGFRDLILASASRTSVDVARYNPNYIGGDIASGDTDLVQLLRRPTFIDPWKTAVPGVYLASSSTAPGPGVHGLAGWNAAKSALRHEFGITTPPRLAP
ncbi:NAD(P)/FAD-dependent oxidoreductase [Glaciihabitans sp. dw_435]|uniref:phytoene desaturase family protein n=1 Tax=Glaciihabitans sp. dw_435 TaxID=2720081 RepID=UPI001BD309E9|nr:NAD(P)/FAD-dependent oxidoreductase [Glaciihabitans sp. dw_435]